MVTESIWLAGQKPNNHCVNAIVHVRTQVEHSSVQTLCCLAALILLGVWGAASVPPKPPGGRSKWRESKAPSLFGALLLEVNGCSGPAQGQSREGADVKEGAPTRQQEQL